MPYAAYREKDFETGRAEYRFTESEPYMTGFFIFFKKPGGGKSREVCYICGNSNPRQLNLS